MSLTKNDLQAIKKLVDASISERVPSIVQPMLDRLEGRLTTKIDQLTLDVGQFSLETTNNFNDLRAGIDEVDNRQTKAIGQIRKSLHTT